MNDNRGQTIFLSVIGIATLLVAIIGATFAYFTTTMSNNGDAGASNVTTAKLGGINFKSTSVADTNILPGWSKDGTVTLDMEPSDVDVNFICEITPSALGDADVLTDFYVLSSEGTKTSAENVVTNTISDRRKFATADKTTPVVIAKGTLKGTGVANQQVINYTVGFEETGTQQNGTGANQAGQTFTAAVTCRLESDTVYYTNKVPGGTTTEPNKDAANITEPTGD